MQLNIGHLDESGVYNGSFSTFALCGQLRNKVRHMPSSGLASSDAVAWLCSCPSPLLAPRCVAWLRQVAGGTGGVPRLGCGVAWHGRERCVYHAWDCALLACTAAI